jgi:hypothetical protein
LDKENVWEVNACEKREGDKSTKRDNEEEERNYLPHYF